MPPEGYQESYEDRMRTWCSNAGMPYYPMYYPDAPKRTRGQAERELQAALDLEDYERAADLRDELKGM